MYTGTCLDNLVFRVDMTASRTNLRSVGTRVWLVVATTTALALAVTTAPRAAHAQALQFNHTSASRSTQPLTVRIENIRTSSMGWRKCSPAFTSRTPAVTWTLTERMEMRVHIDGTASGVIVLPDRSYVCANEHRSFWLRSWPAGPYKLYLTSSSNAAQAVIRFDNSNLEKQQLAQTMAALPEVELGSVAHNPQFTSLRATFAVEAGNAGSTCAKAGQRVMALARLRVDRTSHWFIDIDRTDGRSTVAPDHELFVLTSDAHCIDPAMAREIPAGSHTLWTVVDEAATPPSYNLEIDDRDAPLAFGDARKKPAGALDYPLVVDGKVRTAQRWFARPHACGGSPRDPDFYITTDKPLQRVTLSLLWSRAHPKLHIYGPIEHASPTSEVSCNTSDHVIDTFDGTYAVWVGGDGSGTPFHVLIRRDGTKIDPMTTLVDPPDDLDVAERAIRNHYPYSAPKALEDWTKLFTTAPDQLFIYTRNDVDLGDQKLAAGEPLLVASASGDITVAFRDDGTQVRLDSRFVTPRRPPTVSLPTVARAPKLDRPEDLAAAIAIAGSEDARAIAAYRAIETKQSDNAKLVDAARTKLLKELDITRRKRFKLHLIAVRKRFNLSNS